MRPALLLVWVLALGCGGKGEESTGTSEQPTQPTVGDAAPAATAERVKPVARKLSKAERKQFNEQLTEGRALQKQKKWTEAMAALEQAVALSPTSDRALSELSWAAFNAGELDRAAQAAEDAIDFAIDPRIKAASLYNLGRIEEARKQPAAAISAYQRSLRLRPNKIAQRQLLALGGEVPKLVSVPSCASFQSMTELCSCLRGAYDLVVDDDGPEWPGRYGGRCEPVGVERQGFQNLFVTVDDYRRARAHGEYLLTRVRGDQRAVVADLGLGFESHKKNETVELTEIGEESVGGKMLDRVGGERIFRVAITRTSATDKDYAAVSDGIVETTTDRTLLFCVETEGFVKCPVGVLQAHSYRAEALDEEVEGYEPSEGLKAFEEQFGKPSPVERGFELEAAIDQKGTVEVTHKSGDKGPEVERYLGRYELW